MSVRTEARYFLVCDGCGTEHHDPDVRDALSGRVAAGTVGWKFRSGGPKPKGQTERRKHFDFCPACIAGGDQ